MSYWFDSENKDKLAETYLWSILMEVGCPVCDNNMLVKKRAVNVLTYYFYHCMTAGCSGRRTDTDMQTLKAQLTQKVVDRQRP